jgi:hypothetical protein
MYHSTKVVNSQDTQCENPNDSAFLAHVHLYVPQHWNLHVLLAEGAGVEVQGFLTGMITANSRSVSMLKLAIV